MSAGIGEQAGIDVRGILAHLVLERGRTLQLAHIGVHAEQQRQFGHLRHVALHVDGSHVGVDARGEGLGKHRPDVLVQARRVVMRSQRMVIRDEKVAFRIVLHSDEIAQRPEIVSQMELSGGSDATEYYIHVFSVTVLATFYNRTKVR